MSEIILFLSKLGLTESFGIIILIVLLLKWVLKNTRKGIFTYYPKPSATCIFSAHTHETHGSLGFFRFLLIFLVSFAKPVLVINPTLGDLKFVDWIISDDYLPKSVYKKKIATSMFKGFENL